MNKSTIISLPHLSSIQIPEVNCNIKLKDPIIFKDLNNQFRQVHETDEAAKKGDYVQIEILHEGFDSKVIQLELGKKRFEEYESVIEGKKKGQEIILPRENGTWCIRILRVSKVKEVELSDSFIKGLNSDAFTTVEEYRQNYIKINGKEIAQRVFHSIKGKLLNQLIELTQLQLSEEETTAFLVRQREVLKFVAGDVEERLLAAYGNQGENTLEECERLDREENLKTWKLILIGEELARKNQWEMPQETIEEQIHYNELIWGEKTGTMEDIIRPAYSRYAIEQLMNEYLSRVKFVTE